MKIIHTADWHLCDRLGRIDRSHDLKARVEKVASLCEEHAADVLLIAGDLFSEQAAVDDMTEALRHLHRTFAPFFGRGGTVLAITGNHDREGRINMVRAGMTLAAPAAGSESRLAPGRMYLVNGRAVAVLSSATGEHVQFVLVPYPLAHRYELSAAEYRTKEEENRLLHGCVADWIRSVSSRPDFNRGLPTVLAAHLHVRGSEVHTLYKLTEREDVVFDPGFLPTAWAYVALGHVHKPQKLNGLAHVRYPGSLDRLDFGERHDERGVLLVDIGPTGLCSEPVWLTVEPTPFHDIVVTDPEADLPKLAEQYLDREMAIVRVTVTPTSGGPPRDEIVRELRRLFPRLFLPVTWADSGSARDDAATQFVPREGFATTVRCYLAERLAQDTDKDAVLALAEEYLTEGGEA
jgi:exonuclease SbcD